MKVLFLTRKLKLGKYIRIVESWLGPDKWHGQFD